MEQHFPGQLFPLPEDKARRGMQSTEVFSLRNPEKVTDNPVARYGNKFHAQVSCVVGLEATYSASISDRHTTTRTLTSNSLCVQEKGKVVVVIVVVPTTRLP